MARKKKQAEQEKPQEINDIAVLQGRFDQFKMDSASTLLTARMDAEQWRDRCNRMMADRSQLPEGWSVVRISDTEIRINANTADGIVCHWILDPYRNET